MSAPEPRSLLVYESSKTYTHSVGLSCCFRQWKADSHCAQLHGYALQVHVTFRTLRLDHKNWVVDFGGLKDFKQFLVDTFDHKTIIAEDDPYRDLFQRMHSLGLINMVTIPAVGCEKFAEYIFRNLEGWVENKMEYRGRVTVDHVTVSEHEGNSATARRIHDGT